ncbi:MAG: efflux RND transporter permease subunit [Desulfarculales bacterium]|jgi:multidrug efflux pump|nr:efflux RND transporter permease subunit [Desulfarculales bacterium]
MSDFFIDRPIFAWVIALFIMMAGSLALMKLPVAQYPDIASPLITVTANYPGASARTVEDSVTQVIEQQMGGIDNLLYIYSTSDSSGSSFINLAFETGTDTDIAQMQVQNKLRLAEPLLPEEVRRQGMSVSKSTASLFLIAAFAAEDEKISEEELGDYVASNVKDNLSRLPGVGQVMMVGSQYAMRIWCDPLKLEQYRLNPSDVIASVREQNNQATGGQTGASPARPGQEINITLNAASRLRTVEEFENILLRVNQDGSCLSLKDIARVELNREQFLDQSRNNGKQAAALLFRLASGANALDTAAAIKKELAALSEFFPPGIRVSFPMDTTVFIDVSIKAVFKTLGEAVLLVFLVMFLFLQNFRATVIPSIAIPVVLLGTFAVLAVAGYSINTLTMFGMVLSIGLLVDDAIVVVENVERLIHRERLSPREAARKSMKQISGALIGVAIVIAAVFVPMAFLGGSVGVIYRQFSITIVTSMILSTFVALTLTPAMCAALLKAGPAKATREPGFLGRFNWLFKRLTGSYETRTKKIVSRPGRYLLCFTVGVLLIGWMFWRLPTSFLPDEDQGIIFVTVQMPSGATFERTQEVLDKIDRYFRSEESNLVSNIYMMAGDSFMGRGENTGQLYINLTHWDKRSDARSRVPAIMNRARARFADLAEARIFIFAPPPVLELGSSSGFVFELQDRGGSGHEALMNARDMLLGQAARHPAFLYVRPGGLDDVEQYSMQIDLNKAGSLGLSKGEIDQAISAYWGGAYVNDFMDRGRSKKVYLWADSDFRMQASDFKNYYLRNISGDMVPFSSFLKVTSAQGSPRLERYNGIPSLELLGEAAPGMSSGQAMAAMERIAAELPPGFDYAWSGISFQEKRAGAQELALYVISLAMVFLCLAALYESWPIPLAVLLAIPAGALGALLGAFILGLNNDVYFKIGLLSIMGLSAKNSILIVEFARKLHAQGESLMSATLEAARVRFRPIIMTSLAFILGVIPLAFSSDAGSGAQNAVGITVVSGVTAATLLGIFLTPLLYVIVIRLAEKKKEREAIQKQYRMIGSG